MLQISEAVALNNPAAKRVGRLGITAISYVHVATVLEGVKEWLLEADLPRPILACRQSVLNVNFARVVHCERVSCREALV